MKNLVLIAGILLGTLNFYGQNGIYECYNYEYQNLNKPSTNRSEFSKKLLLLTINEYKGEFLNGFIFYETGTGDKIEFYEWELISIKNSKYDASNNSYSKIYKANLKLLGVVVAKNHEINIITNTKTNTISIAIYQPEYNARIWFKNLKKL